MKVFATKFFATFFGVGYLPYCPGTWGSLAAVGVYFLLISNPLIYLVFTVVLLIIGFVVSRKAEEVFGKKDASVIVIDEACALLIILFFIPSTKLCVALTFLAFRFFDIAKIYPLKKIEKFSGSWGIMLDDLGASLYALGSIWLAEYFFKISSISI